MKKLLLLALTLFVAQPSFASICGQQSTWDTTMTSHTQTSDGSDVQVPGVGVGDKLIAIVIHSTGTNTIIGQAFEVFDSTGTELNSSTKSITGPMTLTEQAKWIPVCRNLTQGLVYNKTGTALVEFIIHSKSTTRTFPTNVE